MAKNLLHGRARIHLDGQFYDSEPGATLNVGGTRFTTRVMSYGTKHNQRLIASSLSANIPLTSDVKVKALASAGPIDITFESDTGKTFLLRNMCQVGDAAFSGGDSGGLLPVQFEGDEAEELTNGQ
ncbi:MAG: hypothetical protein FJX23_10860 [Alphaproteobacteria bacterium]|nr:hypothetical protein [Alphaproteobacteria bacterium]